MEDLLTAEEISKILKVSKIAVYQWARRGLLPHYKIEKCIRFSREDIQAFLRERRVAKNRAVDRVSDDTS